MGESAIFKDCVFPDDCECAKRGYELERDSCAVPAVAAAAARVGVDPTPLMRLLNPVRAKQLPPRITLSGTVQPLGDTGNLYTDVHQALKLICPRLPFTPEQIGRIKQRDQISAGLQAEAGYGGGGSEITIFYTSSEDLRSGAKLMRLLALGPTEAGDGVFWMIGLREADEVLQFGDIGLADRAYGLLKACGGGSAGPVKGSWSEAPTAADLAAMD